jgi:hypothetical protein
MDPAVAKREPIPTQSELDLTGENRERISEGVV